MPGMFSHILDSLFLGICAGDVSRTPNKNIVTGSISCIMYPNPCWRASLPRPNRYRYRRVIYRHLTVTLPLLYRSLGRRHLTVTLPSHYRHIPVNVPSSSLDRHFTVTSPSLYRHFTVTWLSLLDRHFTVTLPSLYRHIYRHIYRHLPSSPSIPHFSPSLYRHFTVTFTVTLPSLYRHFTVTSVSIH